VRQLRYDCKSAVENVAGFRDSTFCHVPDFPVYDVFGRLLPGVPIQKNPVKKGPGMKMVRALREHIGLVPNPVSRETKRARPRTEGADVSVSVCPYCAVGCSQLVYTKQGRIINVEGNYESPINGGTLCPKGAAVYGLLNNPHRETKVKYRAPYSDRWEERSLDWVMDRIAQLVKETRDATYEETDENGLTVNRTVGIGHLGGATLDNEENYLIKKLFTAGLGILPVENQARI
jgi:formate dehydrogenase major subunit